MTYFKSLLINFLTVFFVDHIVPGVEINYYSKLPDIGGDLIFSFALGLINSLIFPIIMLFRIKPTHFKMGIISFFVSFGAYSIVNILPVGVHISTAGAFIWSGAIVWAISYFTNHLEARKHLLHVEAKAKAKEEKEKKEREDREKMEKEEREKAEHKHKKENNE